MPLTKSLQLPIAFQFAQFDQAGGQEVVQELFMIERVLLARCGVVYGKQNVRLHSFNNLYAPVRWNPQFLNNSLRNELQYARREAIDTLDPHLIRYSSK